MFKRMRIKSVFKACMKKAAALVVTAALLCGPSVTAFADTDITSHDPNAPDGFTNLAIGKMVTASSSYEKADEGWSAGFVNDGKIGTDTLAYGWSTNPYTTVTDPATEAWITIDLGVDYHINRVVLYPRATNGGAGQYFPVDYSIQVSSDGDHFTSVKDSADNVNVGSTPQIADISSATGRYIRMLCTKQTNNGSGNYLVQLAEMAVYGELTKSSLTLNKTDLNLKVGDTEQLKPTFQTVDGSSPDYSWTSSDSSVASVSDGTITALQAGNTDITLEEANSGLSVTCSVEVTESATENDQFMISVFWPPTKQYVNDEQYDYLKDAHINFIQNVNSTDLTDKQTNLDMARLAAARGMKIGVCDSRFPNFINMTDSQIASIIDEYKHVPGVGGYYICDEPSNANDYARVYQAILKEDPQSVPYLNFLPQYAYSSVSSYKGALNDFAQMVGTNSIKYLMYDNYPFNTQGTVNDMMFQNMDSVWKVGLKNNVKTGLFIQSVGIPNGFRRTNGNEIRYEISSALAYGFKQISYFTWFTPTHQGETFTDAIIQADGTPTDLYDSVKEINAQVEKLGPTLMQLDAQAVYHSGTITTGTTAVPKNFFFQVKGNDDVILSYMRDKNAGTNYIMAVNKSYVDSKSITFTADSKIDSITEIDKDTGADREIAKNSDGTFTMDFQPGEAKLLRMPDGFDYSAQQGNPPADGTNLALDKAVSGSSSLGKANWFLSNTTDGVRFSQGDSNGWQSVNNTADDQHADITVDLGSSQQLNRVDLYPAGTSSDFASFFPKDFDIQVSDDKADWITVSSNKDYPIPQKAVPSITFPTTKARYVRLNVTKMRSLDDSYQAQISEIEIYKDNGTVPNPPETPYQSEVFVPGMNLALNKAAIVSSSTEVPIWGWASSYLTDGLAGSEAAQNNKTGWTSQTGVHKTQDGATESVMVKLGNTYYVNSVVVTPRGDTANAGLAFPEDYKVDVSLDGTNWTTVRTVTGDAKVSADSRVLTFDPVQANYVRFTGTKLTMANNAADGYVMQLSEFEVYGSPDLPKTQSTVKVSNITLDGDLQESAWTEPMAEMKKVVEGASSATISGKFSTAWDQDNFYIGLSVSDPTSKKTDFSQDSITAYFSPKNFRGTPYSADDFQIQIFDQGSSVTMGADSMGKNHSFDTSKVKVAAKYSSTGYVMEIAVPWSEIGVTPKAGMKMGYDMMAFDGNDNGSVLVWSGDSSDWKDTSNYGTLTLTEKSVVDHVSVTPSSVSLQKGSSQQFSAAVIGTNYPSQKVTWSLSGNNNVNTSISANGLLTVAGDETARTFTVTATSIAEKTKTGTATVVLKTNHHSENKKSETQSGTPSNSTVQTTTDAAGGIIASVAVQPDTAPVLADNQATVSATVPSEITSVLSTATAEKPVRLNITAPADAMVQQLQSSAEKTVGLSIQVPPAIANNTNTNAKVSIMLKPAVLQAAKNTQKDLTLTVTNSQTGAMVCSWTFTGKNLQNSAAFVTGVDLAITVEPVSSNATAAIAEASQTADQPSGLIVKFGDNGLLPAPASVKVYVGNQSGVKPNSKVYLYYLNRVTNALELLPQTEYIVDAQGYLTFSIAHCSDYVLLPKAAKSTYPVQSDTTFPVGIKNGQTYTFAITASDHAEPTFTVGNGQVLAQTVKRQDGKYYVTVKAVGFPGAMTALYSKLPGQKPTVLCYIAVVK